MPMLSQSALVVAIFAIAASAVRSNLNTVRTIIDVDSMEHNIDIVADAENISTNTSHSQGGTSDSHLQSSPPSLVSKAVGNETLQKMIQMGAMQFFWHGDDTSRYPGRYPQDLAGFARVRPDSRMHAFQSIVPFTNSSKFTLKMDFSTPHGRSFSLETKSEFLKHDNNVIAVFDLPGMKADDINALVSLRKLGDVFRGSKYHGGRGGLTRSDECTGAEDMPLCLQKDCRCCMGMEGQITMPLTAGDLYISLRLKRLVDPCVQVVAKSNREKGKDGTTALRWAENKFYREAWTSFDLVMAKSLPS